MAPRFDQERLLLQLSVADILERDAGRKIGFVQRSGYERLWVGQAIHSRYQEQRMAGDPSYRREVAILLEIEHRGWTVQLRGRIDGLRREADGSLVVEEIKSVRPDTPLAPGVAEMYQRQARLYAWMLGRLEAEEVAAELVLIEIGTGGDSGTERHRLEVDAEALELGLRRRINTLLREHQARQEAARRRRLAAQNLEFPFHRERPGQREIIAGVERALEQSEHLLVEAATGLGKTVSCLYPVLRHALEHDLRVFVLTAKTLQQAMSTQVLELLNRDGAFHSLQLRAKARMCANDEILCHEEYCNYAKDYFPKLTRSQLVPRLLERHSGLLPDDIFEAAKRDTVCPFEVSLELAQQVQAVVCDYNYAFDPYVQLHDFAEDNDLGDVVLVIDEIHNLVDRGRAYYSPQLSAAAARAAAEGIAALGSAAGAIGARLRVLCLELAATIERAVLAELPEGTTDGAVEADLPEETLWELRPELDRAFIEYLEHRRETRSFRAEDPFVGLYFDLLRFVNTLLLAASRQDDAFSRCLQVQGGDPSLRLLCKDASRYLGRVINRCHSVIGLSATLQPVEFHRDLLGFDPERTSDLRVANPFPPENRRVVIDSSVATTYRERARNYRPIAERLAEFAGAVPGNCLALFPSYVFLREVAERMPSGLGKRLLIQQRADGQSEREQILDALRSSLLGDTLLLAVAGGVFAEGVDYPGEMLSAVAIVGPCLPAVSLEQKLLQRYFDERFDRGFEYAFVVPGMTRVVQAAGRLIRSAEDRGVIALLDRRFLSPMYRRHMPADWLLEPETEEPLVGHPASIAAAFFADARDSAAVAAPSTADSFDT